MRRAGVSEQEGGAAGYGGTHGDGGGRGDTGTAGTRGQRRAPRAHGGAAPSPTAAAGLLRAPARAPWGAAALPTRGVGLGHGVGDPRLPSGRRGDPLSPAVELRSPPRRCTVATPSRGGARPGSPRGWRSVGAPRVGLFSPNNPRGKPSVTAGSKSGSLAPNNLNGGCSWEARGCRRVAGGWGVQIPARCVWGHVLPPATTGG